MSIYLKLFIEFAKIGLFTFGGGMATIPFLQDLAVRTGWFTLRQLTDFIAISESTPGPMAINMATYAGFTTGGVLGGCVATFGVIFPALVITTVVAGFLDRFRTNEYVNNAFYGLRACVIALIGYAFMSIVKVSLLNSGTSLSDLSTLFNYRAVLIFIVMLVLTNLKKLDKVHPVAFLALSAVMGIMLF